MGNPARLTAAVSVRRSRKAWRLLCMKGWSRESCAKNRNRVDGQILFFDQLGVIAQKRERSIPLSSASRRVSVRWRGNPRGRRDSRTPANGCPVGVSARRGGAGPVRRCWKVQETNRTSARNQQQEHPAAATVRSARGRQTRRDRSPSIAAKCSSSLPGAGEKQIAY